MSSKNIYQAVYNENTKTVTGKIDGAAISLTKDVDYTVIEYSDRIVVSFTDQCKYYYGTFTKSLLVTPTPDQTPASASAEKTVASETKTTETKTTETKITETKTPEAKTPEAKTPEAKTQPQKEKTKKALKPSKPGKPSITDKKRGRLKIKWKTTKNAKEYEVWVSTSKSFKGPIKKTVSGTSVTVKNLKKGKRYYVKVRAINGDQRSGWSKKASKMTS